MTFGLSLFIYEFCEERSTIEFRQQINPEQFSQHFPKTATVAEASDELPPLRPLTPRKPRETVNDFPLQPLQGIAQLLSYFVLILCVTLSAGPPLFIWFNKMQRQTASKNKGDPHGPLSYLKLNIKNDDLFDGPIARKALSRLHTPVSVLTRRLDVVRTVNQSVRAGGLFSPVYAWQSKVPEVMVWIDSRGQQDPIVALAETLVQRLRENDLIVHAYSYHGTPEFLFDRDRQTWHGLNETAGLHQGCRLMIVGQASGLVDLWSQGPLPWLSDIASQFETVVLDPVPQRTVSQSLSDAGVLLAALNSPGIARASHRFTQRNDLASGLDASQTLPGQALSQQTLPEQIPAEPYRPLPALLRANERWRMPVTPDSAALQHLIRALQAYLGEDGMEVLSAAAAYPEFRWGLLRALDISLLPDSRGEAREARLLRLAQLPWSRDGWLPDWLRLTLMDRLSWPQRQKIHRVYQHLLVAVAQQGKDNIDLPVSTGPLDRTLASMLKRWFYWNKAGHLEDRLFVELMMDGPFNRLAFELPRALEKVLPFKPRFRRSVNTVVVCLVAGLLGGGGFFAWQNWLNPDLQKRFETRQLISQANSVQLVFNDSTALLAAEVAAAAKGNLSIAGIRQSEFEDAPFVAQWSDQSAVLVYSPQSKANAQWLAKRIAYAGYGMDVTLVTREEAKQRGVASQGNYGMLLWLNQSSTVGSVFTDSLGEALSDQVWTEAWAKKRATVTYEAPDKKLLEPKSVSESDPAPTLTLPSKFRDELRSGGKGPVMVRIPAGEFLMGSPSSEEGRDEDEEAPQHPVTVASFALGQYEVTFEEYARFVKDDKKRQLPEDRGWGKGNRPVINVSWNDAVAYAQWLSQQTGQQYTLPTEAQWEYAARAGTSTAYPWGNKLSHDYANYSGINDRDQWQNTSPVGSFSANGFGLYDMHGNVWEWTQDCWHSNYNNAPADGSAWLEKDRGSCDQRVLRGGAWGNTARNLRSAFRFWFFTVDSSNLTGFRVARTVDKSTNTELAKE